jgi:hypothetical protein
MTKMSIMGDERITLSQPINVDDESNPQQWLPTQELPWGTFAAANSTPTKMNRSPIT